MKEILERITENLFLTEPLLFSIFCTHKMIENNEMDIEMRSGKQRIEYNSILLSKREFQEIEEFLKVELIRIVLKHPYQRKESLPKKEILSICSDIVINENYSVSVLTPTATAFGLPRNYSYEEYYKEISKIISPPSPSPGSDDSFPLEDNSESNSESNSDSNSDSNYNNKLSNEMETRAVELSELWEEDELMIEKINGEIRTAEENNSWGSIPGKLKGLIYASLIVKLNYKKILKSFRASIINDTKVLTRLKPSRRYGFEYPGRKRDFYTKLLIAVDVSGSISNKNLQSFFSIINRFFKYEIKELSVLQFDTCIKEEPQSLKKAQKEIKVLGRGGTSFQPIFDYICDNPRYDGIIILTDGYASIPELKRKIKTRILWTFVSEEQYKEHKDWVRKIPKSKAMWIY